MSLTAFESRKLDYPPGYETQHAPKQKLQTIEREQKDVVNLAAKLNQGLVCQQQTRPLTYPAASQKDTTRSIISQRILLELC